MSKEILKQQINADITTNGLQQITGAKLNSILNNVVDEMAIGGGVIEEGNTQAVSGGEVFNAINGITTITPINLSTPSPEQNGIFQPTEVGVYENFGGLELTNEEYENNIVYFYYLDGVFSKQSKGVLTVDEVNSEGTNAVNGKAVFDYTNQTIDTIADLRLFNGKEGQIITLLGYYEAGDKEPLNYKWTSEQGLDDGGSVINTDSGSWLAVFNKYVNIIDFGAKGDRINDDTLAIQNAINYLKQKNEGGSIYIPAGVYKVTSTINFFLPNSKSIEFFGDGIGSSILEWHGTTGTLLSNETDLAGQWQYNTTFKDFHISSRYSGRTTPVTGSVGLHVEMTRNSWYMQNVRISGFDTGLFIGVHSEAGKFEKCSFYYNNYGVNNYGDQADANVFDSCWFVANKYRGIINSAPRTTLDTCLFLFDPSFSDANIYYDIQVGHQNIRLQDKNKSNYLMTSTGNGGGYFNILNCFFEGGNIDNNSCILLEDIDSSASTYNGLTVNNNYFALYQRDHAISINKSRPGIFTQNNKISSTVKSSLVSLDSNITVTDFPSHNEPFIARVYDNVNSRFKMAFANVNDFNRVDAFGNSVLFSSAGWNVQNPHFSRGVSIDADLNATGQIQSKFTASLTGGSILSRFNLTSCPVGYVYIKLNVGSLNNSLVNISVNNGVTNLHTFQNLHIGNDKQIIFGFNNTSVGIVNIDFVTKETEISNEVYFKDVFIKHENANINALFLEKNGIKYTNRNNQIYSVPYKIPNENIFNYSNYAEFFYNSRSVLKTSVNSYTTADNIIELNNVSGVLVGDLVYFRRTINNVLTGFQGVETGNKITGISGNVITLNNPLPFNILAGSQVLVNKIYKNTSTAI